MNRATAELMERLATLEKVVKAQEREISLLMEVVEKISPGTLAWYKVRQVRTELEA